jgi:predicted secreted protein
LPSQKTGKAVRVSAIFKVYKYHKKYFESLLSENSRTPEDDKEKIRNLLKKRRNPYVHRHSAITEKSSIISSDTKLRQFAGWTARSNMHYRYQHIRGNESQDVLCCTINKGRKGKEGPGNFRVERTNGQDATRD